MLKIKDYLIPKNEIVYIKYSDYSNIIYVSLKNEANVIQINNCSKEDFNDLVEKVDD